MKNFKLLFLSIIMALAFVACDEPKQVSLLDYVPQSAEGVMSFNAQKFFSEAGCDVIGDKVEMNSVLRAVYKHFQYHDALPFDVDSLLASGSVDTRQIIAYEHGGCRLLSFILSDRTALDKQLLRDDRSWTVEGDYETIALKNQVVMLRECGEKYLCWVGHGYAPSLIQSIEEAILAPISACEWKREYLCGDRIFSGLFDANFLENAMAAIAFDSERDYATIDLKFLDSEGKRVAFIDDQLAPINAEFIQYLYPHDNIAFAVGIPDSVDWNSFVEEFSPRMNNNVKMAIAMAMPYLYDVSGTLAVAVGPAAGAQSILNVGADTWDFVVQLPFKENRATEIYQQVKAIVESKGGEEIEGCLEYKVDDVIYLLALDGNNLIFSNREIMKRGDASIAPDVFDGKLIAFAGEIGYASELSKALELPFGVSVSAWCEEKNIHARARLNKSGNSFLNATLNELVQRKQWKE